MEIFARLRLKAQKWWMEMRGQQKTAPSPLPPPLLPLSVNNVLLCLTLNLLLLLA